MRTITLAAAVIAAGLLLTACGGNAIEDAGKAEPEETITPAVEDTGKAAAEAEDKAQRLTDTVKYDDGITVALSGFTRGVSSDYAAPAAHMPYIKFTIKIRNGSKKTMDLNELSVGCQYGDEGKQGEQVFDEGLDMPTTHLRPGRSIAATTACELPKKESYVQIEVMPGFESETAIFAGQVK